MNEFKRNCRLFISYFFGHKKKVIAGIVEKDGKILIARRAKGSRFEGKWEFPGGKLEPGESQEECLVRELMEELNIKCRIGDMFLSNMFRYIGVSIELVIYKAEYISGEVTLKDHDESAWVSPHELKKYDFVMADRPAVEKLMGEKA
jgi:8-oxo-dGTP diphosphatase